MKDGDYDGPMNGMMRGYPLVNCATHGIWYRANRGCVACHLQAALNQAKAQLEQCSGGGNGTGR